MAELCVLDRTGDSRLMWDKMNKDEVEAARVRFNELKSRGYAPFQVNKKGDKGEQLDVFDPSVERIIMVPQMVGG